MSLRLLGLVLVLVMAGCSSQGGPEVVEVEPADITERVLWEPVKVASDMALVNLPGEVVLPSYARFELAPAFSGRLVRWQVAVGDRVEVGQPLASLLSTDLAELESAERELASVVRARRRLRDAQKKSVESGMQPIQTLYEAELALSESEAQLANVKRQLRALKELGGAQQVEEKGESQWLASVPGVVQEVRCAPGTMITPDSSCFTLIDTEAALLKVNVPERYLMQIGDDVRVDWLPAGLKEPEKSVAMSLQRRDNTLNPKSRTLSLYFKPEGDLPPTMRSGATGIATVVTGVGQEVVMMPREAVTRLEGKSTVFIPDEEKGYRAIPIEVIGHFREQVLVLHPELKAGSDVATRGVFLLKSVYLLEQG